MRKSDEISLEELYKILHVSKRKAKWILENGIIPCRKRDVPTHKYAIKLNDVLEYLKKDKEERHEGIPVGIFSSKASNKCTNPYYLRLNNEEKENFKKLLENELIEFPDTLTIEETAKATGYCSSTIYRLARNNKIYSAKVGTKTIVSKKSVMDLFSSEYGFKITPKSSWHKCLIETYKKNEDVHQ